MRLLNVRTFDFTIFRNEKPKYAIASHRWVHGHEATFKDVRKKQNTESIGYGKIEAFAKYIRESTPLVEWLWIDTCCINQQDSAELSEAVNLMFEWYRNAEICVAYLADVEALLLQGNSAFEDSEWFRRGWTLQELLAPRTIIFVTKEWQVIGNKGGCTRAIDFSMGPSLEGELGRITNIPEVVLHDYDASLSLDVNTRLSWMDGRRTTREEDMSYALYGIFGVAAGANYGERHEGARERLLSAIQYQSNKAAREAERFRVIANWISPADPWTNHQTARQRHEPKTGVWLLQSAQYQSWKSCSGSDRWACEKSGNNRHLWLHGKAGCGKTVLCSTIIEDVRTHCGGAANCGFAFFYFTFSDSQKQSYEDLLRSMTVQLGWKEPARSMLEQARDENRSLPSPAELERIIIASIESYDETFVILDALDECPEGGVRLSVLDYLERFSRVSKLRMLITSREVSEIGESMAALGYAPISIETKAVDVDIRRYVSAQLLRDRKLRRLNSATRTLIEETMVQKADGMFRWAFCQLQELQSLPSMKPKYIRETLRSLPLTLDATYERMLTRIKPMFRKEALELLRWIVYARSPLSLAELAETTIINPAGEGCIEEDERGDLQDALDILSGLIIVQEDDMDSCNSDDVGTKISKAKLTDCKDDSYSILRRKQHVTEQGKVRLAHFSVQEYLESNRIFQGESKEFHLESRAGHTFLAQSCLTYLLHYSGSGKKLSAIQDLETFPLLTYAARSWPYHSSWNQSGEVHQHGEVAREILLLTSEGAKRDWLLVCQLEGGGLLPFSAFRRPVGSAVYYASLFGLEAVISGLLEVGCDVNVQGGWYGNALQVAINEGHEKVVQLLIGAGADVNAHGGPYRSGPTAFGTALMMASSQGYQRVVQMLLEAGSDVNAEAEQGEYGNALQAACSSGSEEVVQMLLDKGADVNAKVGKWGYALLPASYWGHDEVVRMLLEAGADINAQVDSSGDALLCAVLEGSDKTIRMLLEAGADVNGFKGSQGTPLQSASRKGDEKMVQILLEAGADIHVRRGPWGSALQAALKRENNEKVVEMLMNAGAEMPQE